ncbi:MAG: ABC transporter permease subunit [Polyangiaceae bacterium]|jgi:hypothetical protein
MIGRIVSIALNSYREAVRARVLIGVFALGLATCFWSVVVGSLSLHNDERVVADVGSASMSLYGVVIAIVLGSSSLYHELEHKTIYPILSRPIRRWEYLVGKYLGTVLTVIVFVAIETGVLFVLLSAEAGQAVLKIVAPSLLLALALFAALFHFRLSRVYVAIPWALGFAAVAYFIASPSPEDRQLVAAASTLAICEVAIVAAVATLFGSFSSPFLSATFTAMVFVIGRSSDTLAHLPKRLFGPAVGALGRALARIFPNLHVYVPARSLLLGQVSGVRVWPYVGLAALHAIAYSTVLLVIGAFAFRRRDFS